MVLPLRDNAPSYEVPWVNLGLILTCVVVFLWQLTYTGGFEQSLLDWGEVPVRIRAGEMVPGTSVPSWATMFTSMFMHGDLGHILGNMYALWLFGDNIEWILGRARYLLFYLTCGFLASAATVALGWQSDMPGIGASGAIAGVMAAYLVMYPRAKITSLMWIPAFSWIHLTTGSWGYQLRNISALWFLGSWIAFQLALSILAIDGGVWLNLGIYAHAAGAIAGGLLVYTLAVRKRIPSVDHHTKSDELTLPVCGNEGDAGGGTEPVASLQEEMDRIRESQSRRRRRLQPFKDRMVEELLAQNEYNAARSHSLDMLDIAKRQYNRRRIRGYERYLRIIADRLRAEAHQPEVEQPIPHSPHNIYRQRLEETKRHLRGDSDRPDWL